MSEKEASRAKTQPPHTPHKRLFRRSKSFVDAPSPYGAPYRRNLPVRAFRLAVTTAFQIWVDFSTDITEELHWTPRVVPYIGYGTEKYSRIICRLVRSPRGYVPAKMGVKGIRAAFMVPAPHVPVKIDIDNSPLESVQIGTSYKWDEVDPKKNQNASQAVSDSHGYLDLITEGKVSPGIHKVTYKVKGRKPVLAPLYTEGKKEKIGVISDIDDTILVTDVPDPFQAVYNMLFLDPSKRRAVSDMARFYNALSQELGGQAPFFYLSTSPWNVEPMLRYFLTNNNFPRGPLLLRDFDPRPKTFIPNGVEHKLEFCSQLMDDFPHMNFILIGDNGQKDPFTYARVARENPGRVVAIGIRQLQPKEGILRHTLHPMPDVPVPVFYGHGGTNLIRTMLPYLRVYMKNQRWGGKRKK
ncbi:MAG: DUF2183 domain-containing protein [Aeriscardovia sp.]|nr:DUF2183 domain-containing protein [Aeriscardovia sp.]